MNRGLRREPFGDGPRPLAGAGTPARRPRRTQRGSERSLVKPQRPVAGAREVVCVAL